MQNTGGLSRRQLLGAALFAGLSVTTLSACGSGENDEGGKSLDKKRVGAMDKYGTGDQFKATKALTFSLLHLDMPHYPRKDSWLLWKEVTRRTNVTFKVTGVPASDWDKKKSLLIGAGDAPLIISKTYPGQESQFVASKAILPVSEYLDLMPNFQEKVKKWGLEGDLDSIRQADGNFYLLPGLHEKVKVGYSLTIRGDILEKEGLSAPTTWDEVHTVFKALREAYPDVYPMSDRWGQPNPGGAFLNYLGQAYDTAGGWGYISNAGWDPDTKKFVFTGATDQYKKMLTFLHQMVSEKLIDPEGFTQSDDDAKKKLLNGNSFAISGNPQELVTYNTDIAKKIKGARMDLLPLPVGPAGEVLAGSRLENGIMINADALKRDDFVALMQFVDWLWYSDAGQEFTKWGVEGTTYNKAGAGSYTLGKGVNFLNLNPDGGDKDLQRDFGFTDGVFSYGGKWSLVSSSFTDAEKKFQESMANRKLLPIAPPHPLQATEQEQAALWETPLKAHVDQNTLKFILGKRPLSEWDKYVAELKAKNSDRLIDMHNKAYERFQKEHG
ncbi:extracellular solute-binding protein [Streptomyces sp. NPDC002896]|uniref:ABC transporter substrate-binding protein n=1 Tax=Streptomyces sp. NPDC002896 TaxID=3154438 RepID=UPI0033183621